MSSQTNKLNTVTYSCTVGIPANYHQLVVGKHSCKTHRAASNYMPYDLPGVGDGAIHKDLPSGSAVSGGQATDSKQPTLK